MIPQNLDLDKLHFNHQYLVGGFPRQRGQGTTVTYLHMMLGEAELGDPNNYYVYVAHSYKFANEVEKAFRHLVADIITPHEPTVDELITPMWARRPNTVDVNEKSFLFTSVDALANGRILRGINVDRVFFDVDADFVSRDDVFRLKTYTAIMELKHSLVRRKGDII